MALRNCLSIAYRNSLRRSLVGPTNGVFIRNLSETAEDMKSKIDEMVTKNKVVVFMKGDPEQPRCGFSNAVVQVMRMHGIPYKAYDVLSSEELRKGIKDYTNWPTIPQVFINGEFVGGCDIVLEKHQNGELIQDLDKIGIKSSLLEEELSKEK